MPKALQKAAGMAALLQLRTAISRRARQSSSTALLKISAHECEQFTEQSTTNS
jgi:hypothetical protein